MNALLISTLIGLLGLPLVSGATDILAYLKYTDNYWQVYIRNTDKKVDRKITKTTYDKTRVSWLDSHQIFINGVQGQMSIVDVDTGIETPVAFISEHINDAVVSQNGRYILYSSISESSDLNHLYLVDRKFNNKKALPKRVGLQFDPAWSSDGNHYYFVAGSDTEPYSLWKSSLDGARQVVVVNNGHHNLDVSEAISGEIAWSSNRSGNYDIWVTDEGEHRQLTRYDGYDGKPNWSSDGGVIYFESTRNGVVNIWAITAKATHARQNPVQITNTTKGARLPVVFTGS